MGVFRRGAAVDAFRREQDDGGPAQTDGLGNDRHRQLGGKTVQGGMSGLKEAGGSTRPVSEEPKEKDDGGSVSVVIGRMPSLQEKAAD